MASRRLSEGREDPVTQTEPTSDAVSEAERLAREAWATSLVMRANRAAREQKKMRRRLLVVTISAVPLSIVAVLVAGRLGAEAGFGGSTLIGVGAGFLGAFVLSVLVCLRSMYARMSDLEDRVEQAFPQGGPPPEQT